MFVSVAESAHFLSGHFRNEVFSIGVLEINLVIIAEHNLAKHASLFPKQFCESACVYSVQADTLLLFEPFAQRAFRLPVRRLIAVFLTYYRFTMDTV